VVMPAGLPATSTYGWLVSEATGMKSFNEKKREQRDWSKTKSHRYLPSRRAKWLEASDVRASVPIRPDQIRNPLG
jgi:hypothetical protein